MYKPILSVLLGGSLCAQTGLPRMSPVVSFDNSTRVHELMRAGNLYLSLQDALALAIENNLDIELQRFGMRVAETDLLRAQGGGVTRGLNFTLAEVPAGGAGALTPGVANPEAGGAPQCGAYGSTEELQRSRLRQS